MSAIKVYEDLCYDEIEKIKFVWKIRDFSMRQTYVQSAIFPSSAPDYVGTWYLILRTIRRINSDITIEVKQKSWCVQFAKVAFYLINDKKSVVISVDTEYVDGACNVHLTNRDIVLNKENGLLPNNELTIVCIIEITRPPVISSPAKYEPPPCRLAEDLGNLLSSMSLSDVTIAVGGAELRAHKAVLAARSAVFAAMFSNQMLEKETSVVEVADMDAEVFQAMLEFMYTGKLISQTCGAHDLLLAAATKYQLERLKSICEETLCKTLSLDNVLENLTLADLHNAPRLKEQCIKFVIKHRANILNSSSWDVFIRDHHSLVTEIIEKGF